MINRDDIEVGDKCYTRDGGCLVAWDEDEGIVLGFNDIELWEPNGSVFENRDHPLDIIHIGKAPKPVVVELIIVSHDSKRWFPIYMSSLEPYDHVIKLTIINGKMDKWEQVK